MNYIGTVIRPPSEANSLILQVTLGCSDNKCSFCPAYKDKPFRVKDTALIESDIARVSKACPDTRRVFLADGDALVIPHKKLKEILALLIKYFPRLSRVSSYGSIKSLETKTVEELAEYRQLKLATVYMGFETGDEEVYRQIKKYGSPQGNVEACEKLKAAGITVNVTVIAGLGGKTHSLNHAVNTAKILNLAQPDQIAVLTLMISPGTLLYEIARLGQFEELDDFGVLNETKLMIENLSDFKCQWFANHASNYYPIAARFPKGKQAVLKGLNLVLNGRRKDMLVPDWSRGL